MIPVSARNIEFVGHTRPAGPRRRRAGHGPQRPCLCRAHVFGRLHGHRCARPAASAPGQLRRGAAQFARLSPANPRRPAADGQFAEHLGVAGLRDPNDYFKASITETFTKRDKTFTAGLRVFDISKPAEPREIAFMPVDGLGLHRLWYVGGRYAYASCHWQGFTDHVLAIIDMQEPTRPEVVGRWWLPGMHTAGGETPSWNGQALCAASRDRRRQSRLCRVARRRADDPRCRRPDRAEAPLSHRNWCPPFGGGTHTPLPLARPQPRGLRRRGQSRQLRERHPALLGVRCARADEPHTDRRLPDPGRGGLLQEGRQIRPAQSARKPPRLVPELGADLRDLPECRGARVRHRRPVCAARGRAFRPARAREDGRSAAATARRSSSRTMSMSRPTG